MTAVPDEPFDTKPPFRSPSKFGRFRSLALGGSSLQPNEKWITSKSKWEKGELNNYDPLNRTGLRTIPRDWDKKGLHYSKGKLLEVSKNNLSPFLDIRKRAFFHEQRANNFLVLPHVKDRWKFGHFLALWFPEVSSISGQTRTDDTAYPTTQNAQTISWSSNTFHSKSLRCWKTLFSSLDSRLPEPEPGVCRRLPRVPLWSDLKLRDFIRWLFIAQSFAICAKFGS